MKAGNSLDQNDGEEQNWDILENKVTMLFNPVHLKQMVEVCKAREACLIPASFKKFSKTNF